MKVSSWLVSLSKEEVNSWYFVLKYYMVPVNEILQNAPKTPQEKILNRSLEIEEDMQKWAPGNMI